MVATAEAVRTHRLWVPDRVMITRSAREREHGRAIVARAVRLGAEVVELPGDRLQGLRGGDERETYRRAKGTLAVVVSPPSERKLQPIPPSADWQVHLARGCPAHCQYCYLAGSLPGPPVTRAYADLDEILEVVPGFEGRGTITSRQDARRGEGTTFEASCYTDPLGIEHLTGSLGRAIAFFARRPASSLRFTTKYAAVEGLLDVAHGGRTRARFSVNVRDVERFEGGTARVAARLEAMGRMARAGYLVGLTIAPIMPVPGWPAHYAALLDDAAAALGGRTEGLTVECITHRFSATSRDVLRGWYPASTLEMDEELRAQKRTRFGAVKHVYPKAVMDDLRAFFDAEVARRLPGAQLLYLT